MGDTLTMALPHENTGVKAFDALYRSSAADLYAYVATLLGDRAAAEDVTALAFERAFRKRRSFDARRGDQRGWLFGIARNAALDELRQRKRSAVLAVEPADGGIGTGATALSAEDAGDDADRRATVRAGLAGLDPRERELVALKFFAGLTNAEIGRVVGLTESNAGTKLHRAVTKLREACA
jgi:RNA polymerase sigma factor (sigma-70 family)